MNLNYFCLHGLTQYRYAQPPVDSLRFRPPLPYKYNEGTYESGAESNVTCVQEGNGMVIGDEDCLMLNIYVPEKVFVDDSEKLTVMVWIHGGGLQSGTYVYGRYGPKHFMDKDIVIVSINYRLGPLGFFSLGNSDVPGNQGLLDQNMAMTWVKKNIENFGGNSNKITIFGESAGALSVALHLTSPMSQGLFQRAILQSGTALAPLWGPVTPQNALKYAEMSYKLLGCEQDAENTRDDILECIQGKNVSDIMELSKLSTNLIWMPVPDNEFTDNPFLPGDAEQLLELGQFNKDVEIIIGTNADEGLLFMFNAILDPSVWTNFRENFDIFGPMQLFNIADPNEVTPKDVENAHRIVEEYLGSVDNIDENHIPGITDMYTDAGFLYGTFKTINWLVNWNVKVFQYILKFQGNFSYSELFGIPPMGVSHADDLIYLWDPVFNIGELPLSEEEMSVREIMTTAWSNFAKNGDPYYGYWKPVITDNIWNGLWDISSSSPSMELPNDLLDRLRIWYDIMGNSTFELRSK